MCGIAHPSEQVAAKDAAELLNGNERLFAALADHAPIGIFVCDPAGATVYANESLCRLLGRTMEETLGAGWAGALHPEDADRVKAEWADASAAGMDSFSAHRFLRPDGVVRWVEESAAAVRDENGEVIGWVGCCVDLTARKLSDERYRDLVENAPDAIFSMAPDGWITSVNRAAEALTGYGREELVGMAMLDLIASEDAQRGREAMERRLAGAQDEKEEYSIIRRDGARVTIEVRSRLVEQEGEPVSFQAIARDTTERRGLEEQLRHRALHDPLTGLPNRTLFDDRLRQALQRATRSGSPVTVMMLDLDGFKLVNDGLGHDAGDELLVALAPTLRRGIRGIDTVARFGGDEFAFLVENVPDRAELAGFADRLLNAIAEPVSLAESQVRITGSLGLAVARDTDTARTLLKNADRALYKAKSAGKSRYEFYGDHLETYAVIPEWLTPGPGAPRYG